MITDTDRLDWLKTNPSRLKFSDCTGRWSWRSALYYWSLAVYRDPRGAIDDAIANDREKAARRETQADGGA